MLARDLDSRSPELARWCLTILLFLAAACGGEGTLDPDPTPDPVADASPGGIYTGTITNCSVCPVPHTMVVSEDGDWFSVDSDYVQGASVGRMTVTANSFTSPRERYTGVGTSFGYPPTAPASRDAPAEERSFFGTIAERVFIRGTNRHGGSLASVSANYDPEYDLDSSLPTLAGTFEAADTAGLTLTYTIDMTGALSGSDSLGCSASGQASVLNAGFNMYSLTVTFSGCGGGGADGAFTGLATLRSTGLELYLVDGAANGTQLVVLVLPRI